MKKRFCVLLAIIMTLSLYACSEGANAIIKKQDNLDRYFLYVEDGKLNLLDTDKDSSQQIALDVPADNIYDALVCDNSATMVARITNKDTDTDGLLYVQDGSNQAMYFGDNTELVRISKDGMFVWYLEIHGEQKNLYRYDAANKQTNKIADAAYGVSVSEDGKRAVVTILKDASAVTLYYSENGSSLQEIDDDVYCRVSVAQDCSAVAYLKACEGNSESFVGRSAYLWAKDGLLGETKEKLPFAATEIVIFDKNNIYYVEGIIDTAAHYYYDGKESHALTKKGRHHGHKMGNYMYYYWDYEGGETSYYLVYRGEKIKTNIAGCFIEGYLTFLSQSDRRIYGWGEDDVMYQVDLDAEGKMRETALTEINVRSFSPRIMQLRGDSLVYPKEEALYLNEQKITESYEAYELSLQGDALAYKQGDTLFRWEKGSTTALKGNENVTAFYPARDGKVVSLEEGSSVSVQYERAGETKSVSFGSNVSQLVLANTWSCIEVGNVPMAAERTGTWFTREIVSLAWNR